MIDVDRLKELEEDFGAEDMGDLIDSFIEETQEALDAVGGMISDVPDPIRRDQFHLLKGCALSIGASTFAGSCEAHERANGPLSQQEYDALCREFRDVRAWFDQGGLQTLAGAA